MQIILGDKTMDIKEMISLLLTKAKAAINDFTIIFLANVKGITTNRYDYTDSSILTEFLNVEEYNEILTALQNWGFYTLTYFNTEDFIKDYFNEKFSNSKIIVFEGTQKGIGKARDSYIPAFCDLEGILHTGPNAYVNSICANKYHWTKLLDNHNISVPNSWRYYANEWLNNQKPIPNRTLIAKPCYECASIGIHKESVAQYSLEYENYIRRLSAIYNQPFIVQEFISGYEIEVPIIINQRNPYIFPPVVICKKDNFIMGNKFLDFNDIYEDDYQFRLLNTVSDSIDKYVQIEALKITRILDLECYARIDFRVDSYGKCYVTDINSYPHIVHHSSFAYAFEQLHIDTEYILPCLIGNILP